MLEYFIGGITILFFMLILFLGIKGAYKEDGLLCLDETKNSILIYAFIITILTGIYLAYTREDIPTNLTTVIGILVTAITGLNIANNITNKAQPVNVETTLTEIKETFLNEK